MISLLPLNYIDLNHFAPQERIELVQGNGGTYYVQLVNVDKTVTRWVPAPNSVLQVVFPRALSVTNTPSNQDVTVTLVEVDSRDASLYRFDLTAANVDKIVSGGAKLLVTQGGTTKTYPVDNFVNRRSNTPGA